MSDWEIINEEASIVLVGSFNPKIFHPEWFIRKGIVEEWDYSEDEIVNLSDMSKVTFSSERNLTVLLNQFSLRSLLSSDHIALKDFVANTFSFLRETPVIQMGMNYTSIIKIPDLENWKQFGRELAPLGPWQTAVDYLGELDQDRQESLGLWDLTMNLPRPDDFIGYIRPRIKSIGNAADRTLTFSINNHIEFAESDEPSAITMVKALEDNWEDSLSLAGDLIRKIMWSQLEKKK